MTPAQIKQLQKALTESVDAQVKITVNGKIERLLASQAELKEWFIGHAEEDRMTAKKMDDYILADNEWKKKAEPVIELGENVSWSTMAALKFLAGLGALVGIIVAIFNISKH